ncbi:MAG: DUF1990 family protein [Armatimonadetes bacterium]|nr:DUF1990 family protein [Armatimonadota bacterium]
MDADRREQALRRAESARTTWNLESGGRRAWVCFDDDVTFDLGPDPEGGRFLEISDRMVSGRTYLPDAVQVFGRFIAEQRDLRAGDRLLQSAPLFGRWGGPLMTSAVEMAVVERGETRCRIGYVTTERHHARGGWSATLDSRDGRLSLRVVSTSNPKSWLFWLGLPIGRALQLRARRRSVEVFRSL